MTSPAGGPHHEIGPDPGHQAERDLTGVSSARGSIRLIDRISRRLDGMDRRGFLARTAVVGSAVAVDAVGFTLRPQTAYATICGPSNLASQGWTVFCCTINKGVNACPPGSFAAGWWKAAGSSWCCNGFQYIVDCNSRCTRCTSGCSGDHICNTGCQNCRCGRGSSATCDQRRVCCNQFRYGQCNTHVRCSGGVWCRVLSCVPPYRWENCTTTSLRDDRTAEHGAPCLEGCGPILTKYNALGANGSFLRASTGPERAVGDGRGRYVLYQYGAIYWTAATGARALTREAYGGWQAFGGPRGQLGYPTADTVTKRTSGAGSGTGWVQSFQRGMLADSTVTAPHTVTGQALDVWARQGRETGVLGFPTSERQRSTVGWVQSFQGGVLADDIRTAVPIPVVAPWLTAWVASGRDRGPLGYPRQAAIKAADGRGATQLFAGGALTRLGTSPVRRVYGAVWRAWTAAGGLTGRYGWPLSDVTATADGRLTGRFEGGTITA